MRVRPCVLASVRRYMRARVHAGTCECLSVAPRAGVAEVASLNMLLEMERAGARLAVCSTD
eukprot:12282038-Alexandrium_andersonii.AAC.1